MSTSCPGRYCGRELLPTGNYSDCGACQRGFRRNDTTFICDLCTDNPLLYDWLYMGFMVLLELVLHWYFTDMVTMRRKLFPGVIVLHISALVEVCISASLAILLSYPMFTFEITSCRVKQFSDWYTLFYNPRPNWGNKIHCTQEANYPLYTIILKFYGLSILVLLAIRPQVIKRISVRNSHMSVYVALWFLPVLVALHISLGGVIYYSFPYLVVILSVISSAAHFSGRMHQSMFHLIKSTLTDSRNLLILLGHWCLHAYGIISITQFSEPLFHSLLLLLVPLPAIFYVLTAKFTNPSQSRF